MLIMDGLANQIIWNPFEDYLVRFIEGLENIDFDRHSMSIGRRGKALWSRDTIRFSLLKKR